MRISDWSSDVCSSDLPHRRRPAGQRTRPAQINILQMNSTITQLHTCLENETSLVCEFIELLEAEAQVLTDGGHEEELAASTAKKDAYARQLDRKSTRLKSSH